MRAARILAYLYAVQAAAGFMVGLAAPFFW